MDDAFTLIRRAVGLLPEDATAENGATVGDVREDIARQDWEMALDMLIEIGDFCPVSVEFWELLAEASRQMMLDRSCRWCQWRGWEVQHGTVRATLSLPGPEEGGRRSAFSGDGRLRPLWDIGRRTADGEPDLSIARLWVEFAEELGPGESADVRLAPLSPEQWGHLKCGDVITMHEARPAVGTAVIVEVLPARAWPDAHEVVREGDHGRYAQADAAGPGGRPPGRSGRPRGSG
ncbi:hypothetical protein [Streptomyces sp. NBC_01006]|uniref:hypothetical protein n=1 Tax=Streptomyces sp. NBC_01006 TaxID=2903716 RepID=UPI00386BF5CB|nr:hypothetical protein OG509_02630 [Streptomyces sp. NBC_01006]